MLKGGFWNSGGFGDLAKHRLVNETIRENKLDFFAISEMGRSNFSAPFLKNISDGLDYIWYCLPPQGRSGGMLVGLNSQTLQVKDIIA